MKINGNIQLKRNNLLGNDGLALPPLASELLDGQLCVNYNSADPALFFKDDAGQVVKIVSEEIIADTLAEILGGSKDDLNSLKELLDQFAASDIATTQATILLDIKALKANKVDKVAGYGLSQNNFSNTLKTKLDGIENGAEQNNLSFDMVGEAEDWTGVTIDNTLNHNSLNAISNSAVTRAFNALPSHVVLTELEYESLPEPDPNTFYYITD